MFPVGSYRCHFVKLNVILVCVPVLQQSLFPNKVFDSSSSPPRSWVHRDTSMLDWRELIVQFSLC